MKGKAPETLVRAYELMGESIAKHREIIATLEGLREAAVLELLRQNDDISLQRASSTLYPWIVVEHRVSGPNRRKPCNTRAEALDHIVSIASK